MKPVIHPVVVMALIGITAIYSALAHGATPGASVVPRSTFSAPPSDKYDELFDEVEGSMEEKVQALEESIGEPIRPAVPAAVRPAEPMSVVEPLMQLTSGRQEAGRVFEARLDGE